MNVVENALSPADTKVNSPAVLGVPEALSTPKTGLRRVGEVPKTKLPVPVSSEIAEAMLEEVVAADNTPDDPVIIPVKPPTVRVPAMEVFPEASVTVNLLVLIAKVVPSSVIEELPIFCPAVNLAMVLAVPFGEAVTSLPVPEQLPVSKQIVPEASGTVNVLVVEALMPEASNWKILLVSVLFSMLKPLSLKALEPEKV